MALKLLINYFTPFYLLSRAAWVSLAFGVAGFSETTNSIWNKNPYAFVLCLTSAILILVLANRFFYRKVFLIYVVFTSWFIVLGFMFIADGYFTIGSFLLCLTFLIMLWNALRIWE